MIAGSQRRNSAWLAAILLLVLVPSCAQETLWGQGNADENGSPLIWIAGAGIVAVGVLDIATAPSSARRHNARALAFAPVLDLSRRRYGLSVSLPLRTSPPLTRMHRAPRRRGLGMAPEIKSPGRAVLWSVGATLVPAGFGLLTAGAGGWNDNSTTLTVGILGMSGGFLVGPSAGHWYADQHGRGWLTTGIRLGLAMIGLAAASDCCLNEG